MQPTDKLSQGQESGKIRVGPGSQVRFREQGWSSMARGEMVWGPKTPAQDREAGAGRKT